MPLIIVMMLALRVKKFRKVEICYHTFYVSDMANTDHMRKLSLNMNSIYYNLQRVIDLNKQLKTDFKITGKHNILNLCISALGSEDLGYKYRNIIPISINTGSVVCTIENNYFVICDKNDSNDDSAFIVFDSCVITNEIKHVVDSHKSGEFIDNVNVFFDRLRDNIKELTHVCPEKMQQTAMVFDCDDNSAHFQLSEYQHIDMYVDVNNGVSIINMRNVKKRLSINDKLKYIVFIIFFVVCSCFIFSLIRDLVKQLHVRD